MNEKKPKIRPKDIKPTIKRVREPVKKSPKPRKKATKAQTQERVNFLIQLKLQGLNTSEIKQLIRNKKQWGISEKQINTLLTKAKKQINQDFLKDRKYYLAEALARLDRLFKMLLERDDIKGALQVQKEINSLLQLNVTSVIEDVTETQEKPTINWFIDNDNNDKSDKNPG